MKKSSWTVLRRWCSAVDDIYFLISGIVRALKSTAIPLAEVDAWLAPFRRFWGTRLEALATEIARGKRGRRTRH